MFNRDTFSEGIEKLLAIIPRDATLHQWQAAYKQVIFKMGLQILEKFQVDAVGPDALSPPPPRPLPANLGDPGPQAPEIVVIGVGPPRNVYGHGGPPSGPVINVAAAALGLASPTPDPKK